VMCRVTNNVASHPRRGEGFWLAKLTTPCSALHTCLLLLLLLRHTPDS
jgi:hypothetical protein